MANEQPIELIQSATRYLESLALSGTILSQAEHQTLQTAIQRLTVGLSKIKVGETASRSTPASANLQPLWTSQTDYVYTVYIKDGRSISTTHGPGCVQVTGYTAQEYVSDPYLWFRMIHKDDRKLVLEQASRAVAGKATYPIEHRIMHKDGSLRWIRNAPVPRYDDHGQLMAYDGLITDITERRKIEDAVRDSEEKYRALFEASRDAIFLESLEGNILDCNSSACDLLGYSKEELLMMKVSDLVPPELTSALPGLISRQLVNGGMNLEAMNLRKDGKIIPCDISTRLITVGGKQHVIAFVRDLTERQQAESIRLRHIEAETRAGVAEAARQVLEKEISERKQAEAALLESEKRYRTLIDTSPDAILYISTDMRVILCNQRSAELFGYDNPSQMYGLNVINLFGLENQDWIVGEIGRFPRGWSVRGKEFLLTRQAGAQFPAEVSASLVVNELEVPIGIISIVRDISKRKALEQYLRRVERLTAMGKISAELAHEIKNPLQSIQSNLELVMDFSLDPLESQEHLRVCYHELDRLINLSNRLLNQTDPVKVGLQLVPVSELFQRTQMLVEKSSRDAGVNISIGVPDDFPLLRVDPDQMIQVLLNLSINAIEAMPFGGQLLINADLDDEYVKLNVTNDGNILPVSRLDDIFEPFYTTKTGGTGLGLPISFNIIQNMGGSLSAINLHAPDRVKFSILLPLSRAAAVSLPGDQNGTETDTASRLSVDLDGWGNGI